MSAQLLRDRRLVAAALLIAIGVAIGMDFATAVWRDYPMVGSIVSAGLLLGITLLWIEEWVKRREASRWRRASFAVLGALRRDVQQVRRDLHAFVLAEAGVEKPPPGSDSLGFPRLLWQAMEQDPELPMRFRRYTLQRGAELNAAAAPWSSLLLSSDELTALFNRLPLITDALYKLGYSLLAPDRPAKHGHVATAWWRLDYEINGFSFSAEQLFPTKDIRTAQKQEERAFFSWLENRCNIPQATIDQIRLN